MKVSSRILALFVLGTAVIHSHTVLGQTKLNDVIQYALVHSREVKKANLKIEEANYIRKEAIGHGLPQIEASGSYSKMMLPEISISDEVKAMVPAQYAPILDQFSNIDALYTLSAGVQVTQLLYSQSYWVGIKTTKKVQELYGLLKNKTEEDVIEEVANSYYQTLSLMLQLNTIDKSLVNLKEIYRIVDLNYRNDMVKESNVNRLKVTITNLEVNQQTIKTVIGIQLNYIKALAGMPADTVLALDTASLNKNINALALNPAFSIENVPSYQVLLKQSEMNNQEIKLARAKYLPTLAAFGQFNYSSYNFKSEIDKMSNMNTIGLNLSFPIFSSGVNYAKLKQVQLKKSQTDEDILKTKDLLTINFNNANTEYQTAIKLLDVQKENRDLALKVYNQTSLQYKEGMASMADVLNVNSDFLQADNLYNQQILKCKFAEIKILKSTGNLKQIASNN